MIMCTTLKEAQELPHIIHIHRVADDVWHAYEADDQVPEFNVDTDQEQP